MNHSYTPLQVLVSMFCPLPGLESPLILLPGGTTSHRAFKIALDMNMTESCNVKNKKDKDLLFKCAVIIWDEALMIPCKDVNMVNVMLKDLCNTEEPFGGKYIVFGSDFRQTLPVVKFGNRETVVRRAIKSSEIWDLCRILKLKTNMRAKDVDHAK